MKRVILLPFLLGWTFLTLTAQRASHAVFAVDTISDAVFKRMQGKSFPEACTVSRSELRYVRVMHWDAEGREHAGEIVCNRLIAHDVVEIFKQLYEAHYPIERIRLIDDYDADDERSMRANNTSSFCFRTVNGSKHLSKHAQGMAIDINTLYNPCVSYRNGKRRVQPETAEVYTDRTKKFHYKIVPGDLCHRLFLEHGFKWGGAWRTVKDYQHFEK